MRSKSDKYQRFILSLQEGVGNPLTSAVGTTRRAVDVGLNGRVKITGVDDDTAEAKYDASQFAGQNSENISNEDKSNMLEERLSGLEEKWQSAGENSSMKEDEKVKHAMPWETTTIFLKGYNKDQQKSFSKYATEVSTDFTLRGNQSRIATDKGIDLIQHTLNLVNSRTQKESAKKTLRDAQRPGYNLLQNVFTTLPNDTLDNPNIKERIIDLLNPNKNDEPTKKFERVLDLMLDIGPEELAVAESDSVIYQDIKNAFDVKDGEGAVVTNGEGKSSGDLVVDYVKSQINMVMNKRMNPTTLDKLFKERPSVKRKYTDVLRKIYNYSKSEAINIDSYADQLASKDYKLTLGVDSTGKDITKDYQTKDMIGKLRNIFNNVGKAFNPSEESEKAFKDLEKNFAELGEFRSIAQADLRNVSESLSLITSALDNTDSKIIETVFVPTEILTDDEKKGELKNIAKRASETIAKLDALKNNELSVASGYSAIDYINSAKSTKGELKLPYGSGTDSVTLTQNVVEYLKEELSKKSNDQLQARDFEAVINSLDEGFSTKFSDVDKQRIRDLKTNASAISTKLAENVVKKQQKPAQDEIDSNIKTLQKIFTGSNPVAKSKLSSILDEQQKNKLNLVKTLASEAADATTGDENYDKLAAIDVEVVSGTNKTLLQVATAIKAADPSVATINVDGTIVARDDLLEIYDANLSALNVANATTADADTLVASDTQIQDANLTLNLTSIQFAAATTALEAKNNSVRLSDLDDSDELKQAWFVAKGTGEDVQTFVTGLTTAADLETRLSNIDSMNAASVDTIFQRMGDVVNIQIDSNSEASIETATKYKDRLINLETIREDILDQYSTAQQTIAEIVQEGFTNNGVTAVSNFLAEAKKDSIFDTKTGRFETEKFAKLLEENGGAKLAKKIAKALEAKSEVIASLKTQKAVELMKIAEPPKSTDANYDPELAEAYALTSGGPTDLKEQVGLILGDGDPSNYLEAGQKVLTAYQTIAEKLGDDDTTEKFKLTAQEERDLKSTAGMNDPLKYAQKLLLIREKLYKLAMAAKTISKEKLDEKGIPELTTIRENVDDIFGSTFTLDTKLDRLKEEKANINDTYDRKLTNLEDQNAEFKSQLKSLGINNGDTSSIDFRKLLKMANDNPDGKSESLITNFVNNTLGTWAMAITGGITEAGQKLQEVFKTSMNKAKQKSNLVSKNPFFQVLEQSVDNFARMTVDS